MLFKRSKYVSLSEKELKDFFVYKVVNKPSKKTYIVVDEDHNAVFIKDGKYINTLTGGKYPVINKNEDINKAEVIFMSKSAKVEIKWGTPARLEMRDPQTQVAIKFGARGTFTIRIGDPRKAYFDLIATDEPCSIEKVQDKLHIRICDVIRSSIAKAIEENNITYSDIEDGAKLTKHIMPIISEMFRKDYGLVIDDFKVESIIDND